MRKRTGRKPALVVFIAFIVAIACDPCGVGFASAQTLTVGLWLVPQGNIISDELIVEFEALHPGVKVELINGPSFGYEEWLKVLMAAGVAPDIFAIGDWNVQEYMQLGIIRPYDLAAAGYGSVDEVVAAYLPGTLEAFVHGGQLWGLPQEWNTLLMYYNRRMLDEAGIAEPTWEDFDIDGFVHVATRTTRRDASGTPSVIGFTSSWTHAQLTAIEWSAHLFSRGGSLFDTTGRLTLDTQAARSAYAFLQELVQERRVAGPIGQPHLFREETAATEFTGAWVAPSYERVGIDFGLIPWPLGPETVVPAYSWAWVISRTSAHPELASEFARFVLIENAERTVAHTGFNLPLADAFSYGIYSDKPYMRDFFRAASLARYSFPAPNYNEFSSALQQLVWAAVGPQRLTFDQAVEHVGPILRRALGED